MDIMEETVINLLEAGSERGAWRESPSGAI